MGSGIMAIDMMPLAVLGARLAGTKMQVMMRKKDSINVLSRRIGYLQDLIRTGSYYLQDSESLLSNADQDKVKMRMDRNFAKIINYLEADFDSLRLSEDISSHIRSMLEEMVRIYENILTRNMGFDIKDRIECCEHKQDELIGMIRSRDLLFNI